MYAQKQCEQVNWPARHGFNNIDWAIIPQIKHSDNYKQHYVLEYTVTRYAVLDVYR